MANPHKPSRKTVRAAKAPVEPKRTPGGKLKLTPAGRALRNAVIIQRVAEGWKWKDIAEEAQITERMAKVVAAQERERPGMRLLERDPVQIIEWLLKEHERAVMVYTLIALEAQDDKARIGALRGRDAAMQRVLEILQHTGTLPKELGTMRHVIDIREFALKMTDAIEAFERGEIEAAQVKSTFRQLAGLDDSVPGTAVDATA